jgi:aspartyl-tRNA(Asn)/glutamyl-tRNA(Gln) amidotransferase subunit A
MAGLRVVVQPNLSVEGWPCAAGSRALAGYTALEDATAAARLSRAGAALIGSSHMAELGFGLAGDTTAQVIAENQADLALIGDTLGEARVAAAATGLFGFKPSFGLISRYGLIGLVPSMECIGLAAGDPGRIQAALAAMAGADANDASMPDDCLPGLTGSTAGAPPVRQAGIIAESLDDLSQSEREAFQASADRLTAVGVALKTVHLTLYPLFQVAHQVIAAVEASSSAGKYDGVRYGHRSPTGKNWNEMYLNTRAESFGSRIKPFLFQGAWFQFHDYPAFEAACRLRGRLVRAVTDLLEEVDLLVLPTRQPGRDAAQADTLAATYSAFARTLPASLAGLPALQVPHTQLAAPTDPGLQLIGRRLDDARLLALGAQLLPTAREGR